MAFNEFIIYKSFDRQLEFDKIESDKTFCFVVNLKKNFDDAVAYLKKIELRFLPNELMIVSDSQKHDIVKLKVYFPYASIIEFKKPTSISNILNTAAAHMESNYFFYMDTTLSPLSISYNDICKIFDSYRNILSIAPNIMDYSLYSIPNIHIPRLSKYYTYTDSIFQQYLIEDTLYPLHAFACYNKKLFIDAGMFDESIEDEYSLLFDFFVRSWLLGYSNCAYNDFIMLSDDLRIQREIQIESSISSMINFRVIYYYRPYSIFYKMLPFSIGPLYKDKSFPEIKKKIPPFIINYKELVKRWRVENIGDTI